jgi:hypothetical protein
MKVLEIQNIKKAIGEDLGNDWRVFDVMEWDNEYHFVCEVVKRVYDPNTFQQVTKAFRKIFKLEREERGMGSYMLSEVDSYGFGRKSMGMPKEDVKDMKILLRYLTKMINDL